MKQDPFSNLENDVTVPDLETGSAEVTFVTWLVPSGSNVIPGERIAELLAEGILFQLESPAEGRLTRLKAKPGEVLSPGAQIARVVPTDT